MIKNLVSETLIAVMLIFTGIAISYVRWSDPKPVKEIEYVQVFSAKRTINIGEKFSLNENVEKQVCDADLVPVAAIEGVAELDGMVAIVKIAPGSVMLREHLMDIAFMPRKREPKGKAFELVFTPTCRGKDELQAGDRVRLIGEIEVDGLPPQRTEFEDVEVWQVHDHDVANGGLVTLLLEDNAWETAMELQHLNAVFWIEDRN